MKKHIQCHYKNGALIFCTMEAFPPAKAYEILDFFTQQGLTSALEHKTENLFQVVGKISTDYDPFVHGSTSWEEVLETMTHILEVLEERLKANDTYQLTAR